MSTKRRYAEGTRTAIETSISEMRKLLREAGAVRFGTEESPEQFRLMAEIGDRWYAFSVDRPDIEDFRLYPSGKWTRTDADARAAAESEYRRRWRVLVYLLKAKLVATVEGSETPGEDFAREMLPYLMLGDGSTIGEHNDEVWQSAQRGALPDPNRMLAAPQEDASE